MDRERFVHLRDWVGHDNVRLARALNIEVPDVEDYWSRKRPVPDKVAENPELYADWSIEVGDTRSKKEQAKKYLADR